MKYLGLLFFLLSCAYHGNHTPKLADGKEFLDTNYGQVHRTCLERLGANLLPVLQDSVHEGMACLRSLKGSAVEKLEKYQAIFSNNKVSFFCSGNNWGETNFARASSGSIHNNEAEGKFHPYVEVNPKYILLGSDKKGIPTNEIWLKESLFHEYMHLIGYRHGSSIETAYTCESCCFRTGTIKELGCKICTTKYSGIGDPRYIEDIEKFSKVFFLDPALLMIPITLRTVLLENPGSKPHLRRLLKSAGEKDLLLKLTRATYKKEEFKFPKKLEKVEKLYRILSEAQMNLYINGKMKKAIEIYSKLNLKEFKEYIVHAPEKSYPHAMWDSAHFDIDTIYYYFEKHDRKDFDKFKKIHDDFADLWEGPKKITNQ